MSEKDDLALMALTDLLNAMEAGIESARQRIKEVKVEEKPSWDPTQIVWTKAEGTKGPYERSEDINNLQFKSMLKDLASHGGRMSHEGYFYWVFKNGSVAGRKLRGKKKLETPSPQGVTPISTQLQSELEKVKQYFPMDLRELLSFEQKVDVWIVKPRQFLGVDLFAKIGAVVKQHDGSWVSAGKESRFEIPKEK